VELGKLLSAGSLTIKNYQLRQTSVVLRFIFLFWYYAQMSTINSSQLFSDVWLTAKFLSN